MIEFKDDLDEILKWLSTRMKPYEKRNFFNELGVANVEELKACWKYPHVKDRMNLEIRKRTTVADCTFKLDLNYDSKPTKSKFIPPTFIDMTSKDE